jgi:hypothetical protein
MSKQRKMIALLATCLIFDLGCVGRPLQLEDDPLAQQQSLENFLRKAVVISVDKGEVGGRTQPWIATLREGEVTLRAIFKYVDIRRPEPIPDSYRYELAAYELTKLLGVQFVPPVVAREIEGRKGSLQIFLEDCISERDRIRKKLEPPDPAAFADAREEIKILENLTCDKCLDTKDMYVHVETWRICRVDFSEAFFPTAELLPNCEFTRCSRKLYQGLLALDDQTIASNMSAYLNADELDALAKRKNVIVEKIKKLIDTKGEEAVLF